MFTSVQEHVFVCRCVPAKWAWKCTYELCALGMQVSACLGILTSDDPHLF